jgi:murein DD-endopeptidase MepM/ murein hydrolase activator NlpD
VVSAVTPRRYFGGLMGLPCAAPVTSPFGSRRSYNGGALQAIHAGTDFAALPGAAVYAPAAGVVALAEPLTVRGNAVIIDHGWGIFTGYWHLESLNVRAGALVQTGDVIGTVGSSGRSTGPHLHWELFVQGVQVDPLQWTKQSFP